ncbi:copper chaperone PCu(A)C [Agromyces sp. Leaf222]|uniref:copper chaperone PCu(A)C n=1 Tax=Agromyces sp. Leaf222 TaxID=1735688 RepID=UPI0006FDE1B0|nr:copper chaperone PCu(A)C [Agromyces sp. Leaf222]KQM83636.1 hypothetical protein ASE68_10760 [Agromyces sp. Leaf222]
MNATIRTTIAILAPVLALALAGCSSTPAAPAQAASTQAESLAVTDAWVKATDTDMTAGFGLFENIGDEPLTIVTASAEFSDMLELHETVENESGEMKMQPKEGGFVIQPGESLTLQPGGDHIMIMALAEPLTAGDAVTITLGFDDGSTVAMDAVVKDYSGANESYEPDASMDMGDGE